LYSRSTFDPGYRPGESRMFDSRHGKRTMTSWENHKPFRQLSPFPRRVLCTPEFGSSKYPQKVGLGDDSRALVPSFFTHPRRQWWRQDGDLAALAPACWDTTSPKVFVPFFFLWSKLKASPEQEYRGMYLGAGVLGTDGSSPHLHTRALKSVLRSPYLRSLHY
jgi:hypothetical protein